MDILQTFLLYFEHEDGYILLKSTHEAAGQIQQIRDFCELLMCACFMPMGSPIMLYINSF